MTFKEYQKQSYVNIQPHTDYKDEVLNWTVGLAEETGEVMNHIKHHFWGGESINKEDLAKEIGDVLWYVSALCVAYGLDLDAVARLNIEKLKFRYIDNYEDSKSQYRFFSNEMFKDTEIYKNIIEQLNYEKQ